MSEEKVWQLDHKKRMSEVFYDINSISYSPPSPSSSSSSSSSSYSSSSSSKSNNNNSNNNEYKSCGVCFEEFDDKTNKTISFGDHSHHNHCGLTRYWCTPCIQNNFRVKIVTGDVRRLACSYCAEVISQADLQLIFENCDDKQQLLTKYDKYVKFRESPNYRECPNPTCGKLILGDGDKPDIKCSDCNTEFCFYHALMHQGKHCKNSGMSVRDKTAYFRSRIWAAWNTHQCPHCHERIEKNGGCPNMTCSNCSNTFCWLCRCKTTGYCDHKKLKYAGYSLALPLAVPIAAVVAVGIGPYYGVKSLKRWRKNKASKKLQRKREAFMDGKLADLRNEIERTMTHLTPAEREEHIQNMLLDGYLTQNLPVS